MADEFEQQLERIELTVAEIVGAVQRLRDERAGSGETQVADLNRRLKHFLEQKKQV